MNIALYLVQRIFFKNVVNIPVRVKILYTNSSIKRITLHLRHSVFARTKIKCCQKDNKDII